MNRAVVGVIAAGAVLGAALLVLPGIIGYSAENSLRTSLKTISQQGSYRIELVRFERGWFTSKAQSRLIVEGEYARTLQQLMGMVTGDEFEVTFTHDIRHGPLLLHKVQPVIGVAFARTDMRLPEGVEVVLEKYLRGQPLLTFRTTFDFLGGSKTLIDNPEYMGEMGPHTSVEWDGASGRILAAKRAFSVTLDMPLFRLETSERMTLLRDMKVTGAQEKWGSHLWLGEIDARVAEVRLLHPEAGDAIDLDALGYRTAVTIDKTDRLNASISLSMDGGAFEGGRLGPSAWSLEVANLSAPALDEAYGLYNQVLDAASDPYQQRMLLDSFLDKSLTGLFDAPVEMKAGIVLDVDSPFALYRGKTTIGLSGRNAEVTIAIDQTADTLDYGGWTMTDSRGRLRLSGLDGRMLADIYADLVRFITLGLPDSQMEEEKALVFSEKLPAIIRPGTGLHLEDVTINVPGGSATASGELGFTGDQPLNYEDMDAVTRRLKGTGTARFSEGALVWYLTRELLGERQAALAMEGREVDEETLRHLARTSANSRILELERQAVIRRDGDAFVIDAALEDGKVMLNGVPRPELAPAAP